MPVKMCHLRPLYKLMYFTRASLVYWPSCLDGCVIFYQLLSGGLYISSCTLQGFVTTLHSVCACVLGLDVKMCHLLSGGLYLLYIVCIGLPVLSKSERVSTYALVSLLSVTSIHVRVHSVTVVGSSVQKGGHL